MSVAGSNDAVTTSRTVDEQFSNVARSGERKKFPVAVALLPDKIVEKIRGTAAAPDMVAPLRSTR